MEKTLITSNGDGLIPVHIGYARCNDYFWKYDKDIHLWVRGEKIPELLNKAYNNPFPLYNRKGRRR